MFSAMLMLGALSAPVDGREVLDRAVAGRSAISNGIVRVRQVSSAPDRADIVSEEQFIFTPAAFRHDLITHSVHDRLHESSFKEKPAVTMPVARRSFADGVLLERLRMGKNSYQNSRHQVPSMYHLENGREMGFPAAPGELGDLKRLLYPEAEVISHSIDGALHTVRLKTPTGDTAVVVDSDRGWSVVAWERHTVHADGTRYSTRGSVTPAQYGGVWYPSVVYREQYRDGKLELARELTVLSADFKAPVSEKEFTLEGMGMRRGEHVREAPSAQGFVAAKERAGVPVDQRTPPHPHQPPKP